MDLRMKQALEHVTVELLAMPKDELLTHLRESGRTELGQMLRYALDPGYNPDCPYCKGDQDFEICGCRCHTYNGA